MDQTPAQPTQGQKKAAEAYRAELERRKQDQFKVYNPTNQDFQVVLNAAISPEIWTVAAHDEAIVPRYVREKYFEEMSNKIIISKSDKAVIEENEKRMKSGFPAMNLHTEQLRFETKNLKVMQSKVEKIIAILDRGLYQEFGVSKTPIQKLNGRESRDTFDPGISLDGEVKPITVLRTVPVPPEVVHAAGKGETGFVGPIPGAAQEAIQTIPVSGNIPVAPDVVVEDDDEEEDDGQSNG